MLRSVFMGHAGKLLGCAGLLTAAVGMMAAAPGGGRAGAEAPADAWKKHWTADNGNGTYSNPLFYGEFEDPDVIRVGNDYYLASTTMHMMPAVFVMHSKNLGNWELLNYCADKIELGPNNRLQVCNI